MGGLAAGFFIVTFSWNYLTPILQRDSVIAKKEKELFRIEKELEIARLNSEKKGSGSV